MRTLVAGTLALLLFSAVGRADDSALTLIGKGHEALQRGDAAAALPFLDRASRLAPDHPLPWLLLANAALAEGDTQRAGAAIERALALGASIRVDESMKALAPQTLAMIESMGRANREVINRSTVHAVFDSRDLVPESLAVDESTGDIYLGSMYRRKIVRKSASGEVTDFVAPAADGLASVLGIKIDPSGRELWANSCNIGDRPPMTPADPATVGRAAIYRWSLDTGKLVARYDPVGTETPICFNDLVVTARGVFATAGDKGLWRVDETSGAVTQVSASSQWLLNGIAADGKGDRLFLADAMSGPILYETESGASRPLGPVEGHTLGGIDGLYLHDGDLIGIQNAAHRVPARVIRMELKDDRIVGLEVLERNHPLYEMPTTGAVVGDILYYIANSQLRAFRDGAILPGAELEPTYVLALPLESSVSRREAARRELLEIHARELAAHLELDVDAIIEHQGEQFVAVSRGRISTQERAEVENFFRRYFEGASYSEYRSLEDPIVGVSDDASMGWVVSRTRAARSEKGGAPTSGTFVYAGVMIYRQTPEGWKRVANVSTFE